jgi:hypothetical protein
MKNKNLTENNSWATPDYFYEPLNEKYNFDFDPCPLNTGEITPENDGLLIKWGQRNFVNPPYSRKLKEAFVNKAVEVSKNGALCVLLLPVSTSTVLFHEVIQPNAKDIVFVKKRIKFKGVNTFGVYVDDKSPMHDSMIVIFDGRKDV